MPSSAGRHATACWWCCRPVRGLAACAVLIPRLNLDAFPDVTNVQVVIQRRGAWGLAAEEVEQLITYPVESGDVRAAGCRSGAIDFQGRPVGGDRGIQGRHGSLLRTRTGVRAAAGGARADSGRRRVWPELGPNTSGLGQVFQYTLQADDPGKYDRHVAAQPERLVVKLLLAPAAGRDPGAVFRR